MSPVPDAAIDAALKEWGYDVSEAGANIEPMRRALEAAAKYMNNAPAPSGTMPKQRMSKERLAFLHAANCGYGNDAALCCLRREMRDIIDELNEYRRAWPGTLDRATWNFDMDAAPKDQMIVVYAGPREGLDGFVTSCWWNESAGFCVDELRHPIAWMPLPTPPANTGSTER